MARTSGASVASLSGNETLTGDLTFTGHLVVREPWLDVRAEGAVLDGLTYDDAALQSAINKVGQSTARTGRKVLIPAAKIKIGSKIAVNYPGVTIEGGHMGRNDVMAASTQINYQPALIGNVDALFELGSDNGHAYDAADYDGIEGFTLRNLSVKANAFPVALDNGLGPGYMANSCAIRDWRGGDVTLDHVNFVSWDQVFWGIQSDLNKFDNIEMRYCHRGIYLGPRSDQANIRGLYSNSCDRALWLDGAAHARITDSQFVNDGGTTTNPIKIGCQDTFTGRGGAHIFDRVWFEHFFGAATLEAYIEAGIGEAYSTPDLVFRDCFIAQGNQAAGTKAQHFIKVDNADRLLFEINTASAWVNLLNAIKNSGANAANATFLLQVNGWNPSVLNAGAGTMDPLIINRANGYQTFYHTNANTDVWRAQPSSAAFPRMALSSGGNLRGGIGTVAPDCDFFAGASQRWKTNVQLQALDGLCTKVVSGAGTTTVADGSFNVAPLNGTTCIVNNTSTDQAWLAARVNGTWRYVEMT